MKKVLHLAKKAAEKQEIPVGAIVVFEQKIIAAAYNHKETWQDAIAHAEVLALQQAVRYLRQWRLTGATLYCNLEPCPMCAGAMINARLSRLVYGAHDNKHGAAGSVTDLLRFPGFNHQVEVTAGVLATESQELLQKFFTQLRRDGRAGRRRSTRNRVGD